MNVSYKKLWKLLIDKDLKKKGIYSVAPISERRIVQNREKTPTQSSTSSKGCGKLSAF